MEYRQGKENKVADALSRKMETTGKGEFSAIIVPESGWLEQLKGGYDADSKMQTVLQELRSGTLSSKHFEERNGYLFYKGRLTIPAANGLREQVLHLVYSSSQGGHSGFHKTLNRAKAEFYWAGMREDIKRFIKECDICQVNKSEYISPAGLLHT